MKKALVLSLVLALGLGFAATAANGLSGGAEIALGIAPGASMITGLDMTLTVDYTISNWVFGSESTFGLAGYSAQAFTAAGALGAFTLSTTLNFAPMAVTEWTWPSYTFASIASTFSTTLNFCDLWVPTATAYGPRFLDWTAQANVSIAGVSFEALVYMDNSNFALVNIGNWFTLGGLQSDSVVCKGGANGLGSRWTISGSFGAATVTSYTYFNLSEKDASTKYCPAVGKSGTYSIVNDNCVTSFYEEYLMVEGLMFGCANIDMAISIGCVGFNDATFVVSDIAIGNWAYLDFGIVFGVSSKRVDLCMELAGFAVDCFIVEIGLGSADYVTGYTIDSLSVHGVGFEYDFGGGITFAEYTELDIYSSLFSGSTSWDYLDGPESPFVVPYVALIECDAVELTDDPCDPCLTEDIYELGWSIECWPINRYRLWEMFSIDVDGDSCCGGAFEFTISTYFGDEETLSEFWYAVYEVGVDYPSVAWSFAPIGFTVPTDGTGPDANADYVLDEAVEDLTVVPYPTYTGAVQNTLFAWAQTVVDASFGIGSNVVLTFGFNIGAYGWQSLDAGFEFTF